MLGVFSSKRPDRSRIGGGDDTRLTSNEFHFFVFAKNLNSTRGLKRGTRQTANTNSCAFKNLNEVRQSFLWMAGQCGNLMMRKCGMIQVNVKC